MGLNDANWYYIDRHVAEWYDTVETSADDVDLIRELIGDSGTRRILEVFCGNGRILIPLAQDGHEIVGLDEAQVMLESARTKLQAQPEDVRERVTFIQADAIGDQWPTGFEVVILGGNCFYELAIPEEQERCIASAARSLKPGGHLFYDSDHMEGELDPSWRDTDRDFLMEEKMLFPDGVRLFHGGKTIWFDAPGRIWRAIRRWDVVYPDGRVISRKFVQQKHPVSRGEVLGWLEKHNLTVEWANETETRITYWARLE